ncbi:MAG: aminomethyl-transferring glycine dehydrogenase subunit GcvPA [Pseudomonadota bacterium]
MRYLPLTDDDRRAMLQAIGVADVDGLYTDVPASADWDVRGDLPDHKSEIEVERELLRLAGRNQSGGEGAFFLGAGAYRHHVPATVDHLIQRSEFLTSYTPYQPEISQGTLHYLFEFQTQVAMLTGMEVANASLYDGSTAASEAVQMALRITKRSGIVLAGNLHPHYAAVIKTGLSIVDHSLSETGPDPRESGLQDLSDLITDETACVVVQTPDFFGRLTDWRSLAETAHAKGALLIVVVTEVVSLGAVMSPGAMGADIVVCEGQSIGNGLNFGGPYLGLFATRKKFLRQIPGRLCGRTVDADGREGFVLTLSTREQHIRRDKATSNICTNSGLCALAFTIHLALLGEAGLRKLATLNHQSAVKTATALTALDGVEVLTPAYFNEFTIRLDRPAEPVIAALAARKVIAGLPVARLLPDATELSRDVVIAATELTSDTDRDALVGALKEVLK